MESNEITTCIIGAKVGSITDSKCWLRAASNKDEWGERVRIKQFEDGRREHSHINHNGSLNRVVKFGKDEL